MNMKMRHYLARRGPIGLVQIDAFRAEPFQLRTGNLARHDHNGRQLVIREGGHIFVMRLGNNQRVALHHRAGGGVAPRRL